MCNDLIQVIDEIVEVIYKLEINEVEKKFIELLGDLEVYVTENPNKQWDEILINLQSEYVKKDYVRFADVLLYDLKPLVLL